MLKKLFGTSGRKPRMVILFDIGSGSVAGSLVRIPSSSSEQPTVLYTKRLDWHAPHDADYDYLLRSMKYTLSNVARSIQESGLPVQKADIQVVLSPLWFAHQPRKAELSRNTLFVINENLIADLKRKEMNAFHKEAKEIHSDDFEVVESAIVDTALNGYTTDAPLGKKAKHIEISLYVSIAPQSLTDLVRDVIGRVFHREVSFSTSTLISFVVSRDFFAKEKDYVFADIGDELTDISIIRNNSLSQSLSFPLGKKFFHHRLSSMMDTSVHEISSLISLHKKGNLHESVSRVVDDSREKIVGEYKKHLESSLKTLAKQVRIPQAVYLTGFDFFEDDIKEILEEEAIGHLSVLERALEVHFVHDTELYSMLRYNSDVKRDLFVALAALYLHNLNN